MPLKKHTICHLNLSKYFNAPEKQLEILISNFAVYNYKQVLFYRKKDNNGFKNNPKISQEMRLMRDFKANMFERLEKHIFSGLLQIVEFPTLYFLTLYNKKFLKYFSVCDILHATDSKSELMAYLLSKKLKIPYVITRHRAYSPKDSFLFYKRYLNFKIYNSAFKIVTVSKYTESSLIEWNKKLLEKTEIIHNAVSQKPENVNISESYFIKRPFLHTIIVGVIAKLTDEKNIELIIDLAEKLISKNRHIQFVIIGEGKNDAILRERSKNLFNVSMVGFAMMIEEYLNIFDILILPSKSEAFGSVILDAMEFGVPVIASNVGGIPEIIDNGKNGLLFESNNLENLEEVLDTLIDDKILQEKLKQDKMYWLEPIHYGHQTLYFKLKENGKRRAKDFSQVKMTKAYESLFIEALNIKKLYK